jgi:hypothetical protein
MDIGIELQYPIKSDIAWDLSTNVCLCVGINIINKAMTSGILSKHQGRI